MWKTLAIALVVFIPVALFFLTEGSDPIIEVPGITKEQPLVFFADQVPLRVTIAQTREDRAQGLSGRRELGPTEGMLFVFEESDYHGIWMKDMHIPLDIIWVNEQFRVVHIEKNVLPDTYPQVFEPTEPARFVIETNSNYADSFKIQVGDVVTLPESAVPEDLR